MAPVIILAQGKQTNIWYFGRNAGLSFELGYPMVLTNGVLFTSEGCATICNTEGQLLFYTDGSNVYNRSHKKMPNGVGLKGNSSSSQSAIIVPKPGSTTEYYIFTAPHRENSLVDGLCYSRLDMTLDNGLGDVVPAEKNIQLVPYACEKLTAVLHSDGESFWVITKIYGNSDFHSYRVSSEGVELNPVISTTGPPLTILDGSAGCLKVSHNGKWIVSANNMVGVDFHHFDTSNGLVTHVISEFNTSHFFGVEFSPNNTFVYISNDQDDDPNIFQYDLSSNDPTTILNSKITLKHNLTQNYPPATLQLGPDGRIYVAIAGADHLAWIKNPNLLGDRCGFKEVAVYLQGGICLLGLPQFIQSFHPIEFTNIQNCTGEPTNFSIVNPAGIDSVKWEFNDASNYPYDTSTLLNPSYQFSHADTFYVKLTAWSAIGCRTTIDTVIILTGPTANFPAGNVTHDTIRFEHAYLLEATPGYASYEWNTGDLIYYINVTEEGEYTVTMKTENGCKSVESVYMLEASVLIQVPNAFTPNGDGLNDTFKSIVNTEMLKQFSMSIYNKWGQRIFETSNATDGWEGDNAMPGVYSWVISYENKAGNVNQMKGSVALVR